MAYNAYDELVTGHPCVKYYWTLDNTPNATVGGINLTGTTTYDTGIVHAKCATFDGLSEELHSASNLSYTDKVSVIVWWFPTTYDTTNAETIMASAANTNTTKSYALVTKGDIANDPFRIGISEGDSTKFQVADYNKAAAGFNSGSWYFLAATMDRTASGTGASGINFYSNAVKLTPNATPLENDLTGNYAAGILYLASSAGSSGFHNGKFDGLAIFDDCMLTQLEISRLYASVSGTMLPAKHSNLGLQSYLKMGG